MAVSLIKYSAFLLLIVTRFHFFFFLWERMFSTFFVCDYCENVTTAFTVVKSPRADQVNAGNYTNHLKVQCRVTATMLLVHTVYTAINGKHAAEVQWTNTVHCIHWCYCWNLYCASGLPSPHFSRKHKSLNTEKLNVCKAHLKKLFDSLTKIFSVAFLQRFRWGRLIPRSYLAVVSIFSSTPWQESKGA